jgi:fibronectin-binding autotransporter adhesin
MKPKSMSLRVVLALTGAAILSLFTQVHADTLYWDGTSSTANADGGNGTWDNLTTSNWDTLPFGGADSQWNNILFDTAFFGGVPGSGINSIPTVSLAAGGITTGGITFNIAKYVIQNNTLTFGGTKNTVTLNNSVTTAAINSAIGTSAANMTFTAQNPLGTHTLSLGGTSTGGWSGTTTINPGLTLSLAASNQALKDTTGITLNGGNILLTNTATGSENTINRVSDTAAITSSGSGSISIANTSTAGRQYSETIGSITHSNGQLSLGFTTVQNGTAPSTQTLMVGGLTRGGTATIAINGGGSGAGSLHGSSFIRVNGITTSTAANEIIGPWITAGSVLAAQSDWAVYQSDGVTGRIVSRGITGSVQTSWTSSSATGNYTSANANPLTSTVNNRLTADRFVNTLRATFTETSASSGANWNINTGTDTITFGSHALTDGDVVAFRVAPTGLTDNRPYYVINAAPGTFQLSLTPGGGVLDLTTVQAASSFMATGLNLNGNTLGMNGYITGTTGTASIGGGSASTITLATATSGNLYLHGANNIWIDPSIKNNGAGVLTLVKSGTNTVTLSGNNTFTGGIVVNAGSVVVTPSTGSNSFITGAAGGDTINGGNLTYSSANAWGVTGRDVTFNGTGSLTSGAYTGETLTVNSEANAQLSNSAALAFATTTGTGTIISTPSANASLNLGNASGFTGNLQNRGNAGGTTTGIQFSSLGDGGALQFAGGNSDGGQAATFTYNGTGTLTFNTRQVAILNRLSSNWEFRDNTLTNNSANGGNNWIINTNLLVTGGEWITAFGGSAEAGRLLILSGTNTADNAFNGVIGNGTNPNGIGLSKTGVGKWVLGGSNTYTGITNLSGGGILGVKILADGGSASSVGASTNAAANLVLNGGTLQYTGGTQNTDRLFSLQVSSSLDASGTGAVNFTNTGAMGFNGGTANKVLTLTGTNTGNNTLAAAIANNTGTTSISKTGIGTWVLSGTNSATGTSSITGGGTLVLDYTTAASKLSSGVLTLSGGNITLKGGSFTQTPASTTINLGGNTYIAHDGGTSKIAFGAITKTNSGGATVSLEDDTIATTTSTTVNGILSGGIFVGDNYAKVSGGNIVPLVSGDYTAFPSSGTGTASNLNYQLTGGATRTVATTGLNSLRITGDGITDQVLNLGNNLNLQPSPLSDAGTPPVGRYVGNSAAGGILYTGGGTGNYTITGTGSSAILAANNNQELIINTYAGTLNIDVPLNMTAAPLTKTGAGTLELRKASNYTGVTWVNQGVVRLKNATAAGTTAGGIIVQNNAALELANSIAVGVEALSITGAGVSSGGALRNIASNASSYAGAVTIGAGGARINSDSSGTLTLSGGVVTSLNNNVTFGGAGNTTVSTAAISGVGALVKDGAGTLNLNFANTYTGGTTLSNGTVSFVTNGLGSLGNITFAGNSTLQWGTSTTTDLSSRLVMSNGVTSTLDTGINDVTLASAFGSSSSGALTKVGSGTLTLTGTNTYTGATTINNGILQLSGSGSINGSNVTVNGGSFVNNSSVAYTGILTLNNANLGGGTIDGDITYGGGGTVSSSSTVTGSVGTSTGSFEIQSGANLSVGNGLNVSGTAGLVIASDASVIGSLNYSSSANSTIDGVIAGTNQTLTMSGSNKLILTGANTYTGATNVTAGVLAVNGSLGNTTTTIGTGATLQGSGSIAGAVTVSGTLATGNSIESLGTGALTLNAGSTFAYELQTDLYAGTPNVAGDLTYVTGNLDITTGALLTLTDLAAISTVLANNSSLTLISYTGAWNGGLFTYNSTTLNDDSTFILGANTWRFNYNDTLEGANYTTQSNGMFVTMTVIPEPNVAALLGCLGVLLILRRRR